MAVVRWPCCSRLAPDTGPARQGSGAGDTANCPHRQPRHGPARCDAAKKPRKLLYYRNPMGLPDTSPVPKKDSMGMDYIAVYEGEDDAARRRAK
jgi:hypothetical protein